MAFHRWNSSPVSWLVIVSIVGIGLLGKPGALLCNAAEPKGSAALHYPKDFNRFPRINSSLFWNKSIHGLDANIAATLQPLFQNYQFLMPEPSLRAGLGYIGAARRLRRFVHKLLNGEGLQLKVGVLGGSISLGGGSSKKGVTDWFSIFGTFLSSVTKASVKFINGCKGGTPSSYMVFCLDHSMDLDVDLVFIEYSLNDGYDDRILDNSIVLAKEQLIRRVLKLKRQPAVVLMQVPHVWPKVVHPFFYTPEDVEGALANYYDVTSLTFRTSMFMLNLHQPRHGFLWNETYDNRHPMDPGHKMMADLAVHLFQEVAIGLFTWPITSQEQEWLQVPMPPPMHEGNYEPPLATCLTGLQIVNMTTSAQGWEWLNEGTNEKPKWGFVSTTPGSEIVFRLGTPKSNDAASMAAAKHNGTFPVLVHYLASYTFMGQAKFDCMDGCKCHAIADSNLPPVFGKVSIMLMTRLDVIWPEREREREQPCNLKITVLNTTTSSDGGHKFKVSGIVFAVTNNLASSHSFTSWHEGRVAMSTYS